MNYTVVGWQGSDERKLLQGCLDLAERLRREKNHSLNNRKKNEKSKLKDQEMEKKKMEGVGSEEGEYR